MARAPTWNMAKHTYMNPQNPVFLHSWNSMPPVAIQQVSLKACRRLDSTFHTMMFVDWINELSNPLDSGHLNSAMGVPLLSLHGQEILFEVNFGN